MESVQPVLYLCAGGGIVIVGGCLWLLLKGKIYLDRETKQVTDVELPLGFKVKSSAPVVVLFVLGTLLLFYAANQAAALRKQEVALGATVDVRGGVIGNNSQVALYASLSSTLVPDEGEFDMSLPMPHPTRPYTLLYLVDGKIVGHQLFDPVEDIGKHLTPMDISVPHEPQFVGDIAPKPAGY
jgi:hypothetical protein